MPFLTPDASGDGSYICRRFRVPTEMLPILTGALEKLTHAGVYESDGDLTPQETANLAAIIFESYLTSGDHCMIGTLAYYITDTPPAGVLACDGSTYDDDDYPLLAAVIGATFDNGDGTFTLPDLRGRVIVGSGTGSGLTARSLGDTGGEEDHQLTIAEMPAHTHTYNPPILNVDVEAPGVPDPIGAGIAPPTNTGSNGGDGDHNNMQPFAVTHVGVWAS